MNRIGEEYVYLHFFFHRLLTHRLVAVGHCALKRESSVGHIRYPVVTKMAGSTTC